MLWSFDCNCPWLLDHPSPSSQVSHHFKPPEHPIIGLRVVVQRISLRLASLGHCKHGPESDDSFRLSGGQQRWQAWQNRGKKGEPNSAGDVEAKKNMGRDSRGRDKCNVSGTMPHPHFKHLRSCIWVDDHNAAKASNGLNQKNPLPQPSFVMYSKDISLILGLRGI